MTRGKALGGLAAAGAVTAASLTVGAAAAFASNQVHPKEACQQMAAGTKSHWGGHGVSNSVKKKLRAETRGVPSLGADVASWEHILGEKHPTISETLSSATAVATDCVVNYGVTGVLIAAPATSQTPEAPAPTTSTTLPPPPPTSGAVGTTLTYNDDATTAQIAVDQVVDPFTGGDGFQSPDAGTRWVGVQVTIAGTSGTIQSDILSDVTVIGSDQQVYTPDIGASVELSNAGMTDFNDGSYEVGAGQTETGWVGFQIPTTVSLAQIQYNTSDGLGGTTLTWTVGS